MGKDSIRFWIFNDPVDNKFRSNASQVIFEREGRENKAVCTTLRYNVEIWSFSHAPRVKADRPSFFITSYKCVQLDPEHDKLDFWSSLILAE